uniref:Uncharacterized protein n=1 Tax=Rhizophora mucronata TaxID=61149 RepID=A0A2P2N2V2_RHIMU
MTPPPKLTQKALTKTAHCQFSCQTSIPHPDEFSKLFR